jgi:hypothetical protein
MSFNTNNTVLMRVETQDGVDVVPSVTIQSSDNQDFWLGAGPPRPILFRLPRSPWDQPFSLSATTSSAAGRTAELQFNPAFLDAWHQFFDFSKSVRLTIEIKGGGSETLTVNLECSRHDGLSVRTALDELSDAVEKAANAVFAVVLAFVHVAWAVLALPFQRSKIGGVERVRA